MLNKVLAKLNGHATDVDALIATLADLDRERVAAKSDLGELQVRRHQALLDDATDATLDKIERDIERKETTLEKLDLAEPGLRERLATAKGEARQRRWDAVHKAYLAAAREFLASARTATVKHAALIAIVGQAQREGFAGDVAATIPATPQINGNPILATEFLDIFERAIAPPPAAPKRRTVKAAPKAAPRPTAAGGTQHAIALDLGAPIPIENLTSKRMPDDLSPLAPGESRVIVLHQGWSPRDDRPAAHAGQRIKMPLTEARAAANRGLVEILEINVDRQAVQGGDWQGTDRGASLTFMGSGGMSMTQHSEKPAAAATAGDAAAQEASK